MAEGYKVIGFDSDDASRNYAVSQMGVITYSSPASLEGPFDVFLCVEGLEHAPSVSAVLREARRLVRPGGLLLFCTPNGCETHRKIDPMYWLRHRSLQQSNHLDDVFYAREFAGQRVLLSSSPYPSDVLCKWTAGTGVGITRTDALKGDTLLCAVRL
jgi:2-polyprenyl-3-methyl-5-hydroxy-6-metoxy-1,4-benzoquinol methylase